MTGKNKSSFVPCSASTGAPKLDPIDEPIENREKGLKVYHVDPEQIKMLERFYGLDNGKRKNFDFFRPYSRSDARKSLELPDLEVDQEEENEEEG